MHGQAFIPSPSSHRFSAVSPSAIGRLPLWPIALFYGLLVGVLLLFLSGSSYHRTVRVGGELASTRGTLSIQARRDATVERLYVSNGSFVAAGAPVIAISVDSSAGDGERPGRLLAAAADAKAAALADQASADQANERDALDDFAVRRRALDSQLELLQGSIRIATDRIALVEQRLATGEPLARKGFISGLQIRQWKDAASANRLSLADLLQREADLRKQRDELAVEDRQFRAKSLQNRSKAATANADMISARTSALGQRELLLTAERPGQVAALLAKPGATVRAGETLATILPADSRLQAQVWVHSRSVGFIRPGERVTVMVDAFPYQTFGTVEGRVAEVSAVPVTLPDSPAAPGQEPRYQVLIDLQRQSIAAYGRDWALLPGMKAEAVIVLQRRSLLNWLLEPFLAFASPPRS